MLVAGCFGGDEVELKSTSTTAPEPAPVYEPKTFRTTGEDICLRDGKPIIRLYSTTWCPHCKWIKLTYYKTVDRYALRGQIVAHLWNMDKKDDALTDEPEGAIPEAENEVYKKFNPRGSVPTFVFGCKYVRVGNGYEKSKDLAAEEKEFEEIIEQLISETKAS